jgi:hypothetical protein
MDRDDRDRLIGAGRSVRLDRERRDYFGNRTADEVCELRRQAARSGNVCADCFEPLAPTASVTMVGRVSFQDDARDVWLRVPICLCCWLVRVRSDAEWRWNHSGQHWRESRKVAGIVRRRCLGCDRPMRIDESPRLVDQVCSENCERKMRNERNRVRRRVDHRPVFCAECGEPFVPKRADAVTCSNRCRQAQHRANRSRPG